MAEFIVMSAEAIFNLRPERLADVMQDAWIDGVRTVHLVEHDVDVQPTLNKLLQEGDRS